jgi:hypothetical protein
MCILNNQLPVNLIAISDKFVAPSLVSVLQSASPLFGVIIKVLMVRDGFCDACEPLCGVTPVGLSCRGRVRAWPCREWWGWSCP